MTIKKESGDERKFSTGAKRQHAEGKGTPVLFPGDAYLDICKHFEDGAIHYGGRNWEKGLPLSTYIDSLERHIAQEKMGLTDESHDRAIAWNAICYLATKLRIKAGVLPKELNDLCGVYGESEKVAEADIKIKIVKRQGNRYYIINQNAEYLRKDLKFHLSQGADEFCATQKLAEKRIQEYLEKVGD